MEKKINDWVVSTADYLYNLGPDYLLTLQALLQHLFEKHEKSLAVATENLHKEKAMVKAFEEVLRGNNPVHDEYKKVEPMDYRS